MGDKTFHSQSGNAFMIVETRNSMEFLSHHSTGKLLMFIIPESIKLLCFFFKGCLNSSTVVTGSVVLWLLACNIGASLYISTLKHVKFFFLISVFQPTGL